MNDTQAAAPAAESGWSEPKTTALLVHRAEYVAGQGVPLFELRPPTFTGVTEF